MKHSLLALAHRIASFGLGRTSGIKLPIAFLSVISPGPVVAVAAVLVCSTGFAPAQQHLVTFVAPHSGEKFGESVCVLDDIDGDMTPDLAVGAPLHLVTGVPHGAAHVLSGATGTLIYTASRNDTYGFGIDLDVLSDISGDGIRELVVGSQCQTWPSCSGVTKVVVADGMNGAPLLVTQGTSVNFYGISVLGGDDYDGDLVADFLVSESDSNCAGTDSGRVAAYSGATGLELYSVCADSGWDRFSYFGLVSMGDVDGDGIDDWVGGAHDSPGGGGGYLRCVSGGTGTTLWTYQSPIDGSLGTGLAAISDCNGDGLVDVVGLDVPKGEVRMLSGSDGKLIWTVSRPGCSAAVGVQDLTGDGSGDVAIAAGGNVHLLSGSDGTEFGMLSFSTNPSAWVGPKGLDCSTDWDGNHVFDLVVGDVSDEVVHVFSLIDDCNGNGVADSTDIATGSSQDCNANGVPDECDLASGYSIDIDGDGQLDDCVAPPLMADTYEMSVATGGFQFLTLTTPHAVGFYLLLGSVSGTSPGVSSGGFTLPLNVDGYFMHTAALPNHAPLAGSFGLLTPDLPGFGGKAAAAFSLPPAFDPALVGLTVHHAYVTFNLLFGTLNFVSNAVPLALVV